MPICIECRGAALPVEEDEAPHPGERGRLRAKRVVLEAQRVAHLLKEFFGSLSHEGLWWGCWTIEAGLYWTQLASQQCRKTPLPSCQKAERHFRKRPFRRVLYRNNPRYRAIVALLFPYNDVALRRIFPAAIW
jgi:hypothetical protein